MKIKVVVIISSFLIPFPGYGTTAPIIKCTAKESFGRVVNEEKTVENSIPYAEMSGAGWRAIIDNEHFYVLIYAITSQDENGKIKRSLLGAFHYRSATVPMGTSFEIKDEILTYEGRPLVSGSALVFPVAYLPDGSFNREGPSGSVYCSIY